MFATEGRDAKTIARFADYLIAHNATPGRLCSVSIDMSSAFISGLTEQFPNTRIPFDKFHIIAHPSAAVDKIRRLEQRTDPSRKGLRWTLLKDRGRLV